MLLVVTVWLRSRRSGVEQILQLFAAGGCGAPAAEAESPAVFGAHASEFFRLPPVYHRRWYVPALTAMAPQDVEVAGPAAAAGQISLLDAVAAQTGAYTELHSPYHAVTAAAGEAPCGAVRTQQGARIRAGAALSATLREDAAAARGPSAPLESAVAPTASAEGNRATTMPEAAVGSFASSQTSPSTSSAGSAAVAADVAEGTASSVDGAAQASGGGGAGVTSVPSRRSRGAPRAAAGPQATASSSDAEAATASEVAGAAEAAAGAAEAAAGAAEAAAVAEVSAAAADGARTCELEYVYVGQDCFFLELPDGTLTCVAGLENLPAPPTSAAGANATEGHGEGAGEEQIMLSRLQCHNCLQLLEFDSRAYFVQCSSCLTLNAVPNQDNSLRGGRAMIVICGRCSTRNISCLGSVYVECWQCHTVCQVDYPTPAAAAGLVNGQGSSAAASAAAAAAAAAAGDVITPAAQLDFGGRGGAPGLFVGSDSRRRLQRLQRRLHGTFWRSDDEESSVSGATRGDRGTRLSTAVELPPRLWSRGRGRSLLARYSFNPLPPRNSRVHVGGPLRGTSSSTSSYREGTSSEAGTAAAQRSFPSTQLQRWRVQRPQHRQRLRWGVRPGTAPAGVQSAGGRRSETGTNSSRLLSLLLRLPFHGKGSVAERRPSTAAALTGGLKNLRGRSIGVCSEEGEQATKTRRTGRPGRRAPAQVFSDRSVSDDSEQEVSDDAEECAAVDRGGAASERAAESVAPRRSSPRMEATEVTVEAAETRGGGNTTLPQAANPRRDREALTEAHHGSRGVNSEARRERSSSENENGDSGATQAGASESFARFDSNASTARGRRAAASDVAETPIDTQETACDTVYLLTPPVSHPRAAGHPSPFEERMSPTSSARALPTPPSAGSARSVSGASRAAVPAPAAVTAATRRNWRLSFAGSLAHARGVGQHDAALTAAGAHTSEAVPSDGELQTNTALQVDGAQDGTDALRKSWRDAIRHWRPQERKETTRARRMKYHVGGGGTGAVP